VYFFVRAQNSLSTLRKQVDKQAKALELLEPKIKQLLPPTPLKEFGKIKDDILKLGGR